jgi:hypothetical protein
VYCFVDHRRTDNTMAKRKSTYNNLQNNTQKDRQYNGQKKKCIQQSTKQYTEGQTTQWPSVYCFVDCCMYFFCRPLCCLSFCVLFCRLLYVLFLSAIVLSVLLCIVLLINNTQKDRQYNGQKKKYIQQSTKQYTEGQTTQWPTEKVHTTIYKAIHRRTDNYFFCRPLYCLSFCALFCRLLYVLFLLAIEKYKRTNNDLQNIHIKLKIE